VRRIAVIPARAGSKRLPDKNIRDFCGKPMIGHVLGAARASGLFDVIHVSTESPVVADVAARLGFAPEFPRPAELAQDSTPIMPVVRHAVEEYARRGRTFDVACLLYACAPLIDAEDLRRAAAMFEQLGGKRVLLSVTSFAVPIEWAYDLSADARMVPVQPGMFNARSQDLARRYHDTGGFAFFPVPRLLDAAPHDDRDFYGFVLPRNKAVDIDDREDWDLAEQLYRGRSAS
jgi:pseudaminic acid cytidylyltransferase